MAARMAHNAMVYLWNISAAEFEEEFAEISGQTHLAKHLAEKVYRIAWHGDDPGKVFSNFDGENQRLLMILATKKYDPEYMAQVSQF